MCEQFDVFIFIFFYLYLCFSESAFRPPAGGGRIPVPKFDARLMSLAEGGGEGRTNAIKWWASCPQLHFVALRRSPLPTSFPGSPFPQDAAASHSLLRRLPFCAFCRREWMSGRVREFSIENGEKGRRPVAERRGTVPRKKQRTGWLAGTIHAPPALLCVHLGGLFSFWAGITQSSDKSLGRQRRTNRNR
jgi:hypothetical protein